MKLKYKEIIILIVIFVTIIIIGKVFYQPSLSNRLRDKLEKSPIAVDSLLFGREMGYVTLNKFAERAKSTGRCEVEQNGDSVKFIIKQENRHIFYAGDSYELLIKFKNLPIDIKPDGSFTAKIYKRHYDSIEYINIPYQILFSLIKNTENVAVASSNHNQNTPRATITNNTNLIYNRENKLIQTEGLVFQNVSQILNLTSTSGNKYKQISELWKYAYQNWIYINDPNFEQTGADTWRSAEKTIESYYLSGKPHKYCGDCDDFAILMASFARQIGFRSRFVCAINNNSGHAYAEFFVPNNEKKEMEKTLGKVYYFEERYGIWVNMDWFSNHLGGEPFDGERTTVYEDL